MLLSNWLHLPVFLLLVYWLWRSASREGVIGKIFWVSFILKLAAGLAFGWLYLHYLHQGDTWRFHAHTILITDWAKENGSDYLRFLFLDNSGTLAIPWKDFSNSFFFLKLLSLLYLLTGNSYWWSTLYLAVFSFWGCWFLVERLRRYFPRYGTAAVLAFLFFPSVVFWTSGLSKDSVFMGSLCLTAGLFLQISQPESRKSLWQFMLLMGSIWILWRIKFFLAAVLIVLLSTFLLMKVVANRWPWLQSKERQLVAWVLLLAAGAFVASYAHPTFTLSFFVRHIVWNYNNVLAVSDLSQPLLLLPGLRASLWSVLVHAPAALWQMVYRPFVWEPAPFFYRLAGLENLLLLGLTVLASAHLIRRKKIPLLPAFLGVMFLFFAVGGILVSLPTPNFGSLHRYRAPLLPFFLVVLFAWGPLPGWIRKPSDRKG